MLTTFIKTRRARPRRSTPTTLWSRAGRRDRGFGLIEALATIAILAALTAGAIIAVPRLLNRGQDSAASSSLSTAVTEARELYSRVTATGGTNFVGSELPAPSSTAPAFLEGITGTSCTAATSAGGVGGALGTYVGTTWTATTTNPTHCRVTTLNTVTLSAAVASALNSSETSLVYYSLPAELGVTGNGALTNTATEYASLEARGSTNIWVHAANGEDWGTASGTNPGGTIRPGQVLRLGLVSESGNSLCALLIADHTTPGQTGTGYEAKNDATSTSTGWADCGAAEATGSGRATYRVGTLSNTIPSPS